MIAPIDIKGNELIYIELYINTFDKTDKIEKKPLKNITYRNQQK